jgi:hypothetical protein
MDASTAQTRAIPDDPGRMRALLDELCAIERPSASPGEREAAEWLLERLGELGIEGRIESEPAHGTYWWPLGIAAAAGAVAGALTRRGHRLAGTGLAALAAAAAIDDLPPSGRRTLRRLLPKGERSQVVAELGPAGAERTVVIMAHHDAPRSGTLYSPAIPALLLRGVPPEKVPDTGPPLMWPVVGGPALVAAGAALGSSLLTRAGTVLSAGTVAALADIALHDVVPAANDNGTGVVGLIALAGALAERPPENLRVIFLSTSEEATCDGIVAFAERHFDALPVESTFFLCLECLGSPHLALLHGEGMLRLRDYPRRSLAVIEETAAELGIELKPNLRTRNATDGVMPLAAGYQCASLVSVTDQHQISNYHWPTDVPENVDYETLGSAIRLSEAAIRRLDERWL